MHDMSSFDKNKALFLRRKHKLYKSLAQHPPPTNTDNETARIDTARLHAAVLNKENQASQLDYFVKHQLKADLTLCLPALLEMLWGMLNIRCGRIISFVVYRLCRKYPGAYWSVVAFIGERLQLGSNKSPEQIGFLSDLILYGFAITADQFANQLFPRFQPHVLELLPRYFDLLQSNQFFPLRHQKIFLDSFKTWMHEERVQLQSLHDELLALSHSLQERLIGEQEDEQEQVYIRRLESYQTQLFRFANAAQYLNEQVEMDNFKLKSIFELKKECRTFKLSFEYSQYQKSLYLKGQRGREVRPLKKSQMLRMEESDAFVTRVKLVCSVQECIELAGYFLQQMNTQHNREYLVELIINDCYHYNNLPYVLKVVYHISLAEPSLIEYCCGKGRKICGQTRMNPKYQKLLCEMSRFGLMDEHILLEYCEKALRVESSQSTREVQAILQHLGTMVYYRSLRTHTRINALFERMQAMMKSKLVHFSIEQLFHLKGLLSYLRSHANKVVPQAQDMAALEIKTNFPFILKKMERLLKEEHPQKVLQFVAAGIDQQDFLNSYYYASLIRDLHHKPLNQQVHTLAFSSITASLTQMDAQRSVCWSRFLGELYNYEIVNRRRLIEDLTQILQKYQQATTLTSSLKCICATLETSKYYLKESEINRDQRQVICFLLDLKKVVCLNSLDQLIFDEIAELTEYFHPFLSHLDSLEKIYSLIELSEQVQHRESIYTILDLMQNGATIEELRNEQRPETKRRYAEKEKVHEKTHEKKWVEKPVRYRQKEPNSDHHNHTLPQNTRESPSKESIKTEQTREGPVQKKQIKVMGRSKGDKRVKVVTATYHQPTE